MTATELNIQIETFVKPEKAPHKFHKLAEQLKEAGPDQVASATFPTAEDALQFVRDMQAAAREIGMSAVKRAFSEVDPNNYRVSVAVRSKISRNRTPSAEPIPAVAEQPVETAKPKGK